MARKPAKRTRRKQQPETVLLDIPAGYRTIQSGTNFGRKWEFESDTDLMGTVERMDTVEQGKGRSKREVRVMEVRDERDGELYTVWESAALTGLFDESNVGDSCYIEFRGYQDIKGRKQPMKLFIAALKE